MSLCAPIIGMRRGRFYLLALFRLDFVSWIFIKSFQPFFEVEIDVNRVWHLAKLIEPYKKCPLGGAKDEHFSCFHSSRDLTFRCVYVNSSRMTSRWVFNNVLQHFSLIGCFVNLSNNGKKMLQTFVKHLSKVSLA